jgi:AmpD protein
MTDPDYWTISKGWLAGARKVASPNYNCRPEEAPLQLIVLHNISLPPGKFGGGHIEALFTNTLNPSLHPYFESIAHLRVSAHFLVTRLGEIVQFVASGDRAWHAGESHWCGQTNCNDFSIGIELEGTDDQAYTDVQYVHLRQLIKALRRYHPSLDQSDIVGHSDIAPGRKTDPGGCFDWHRLADVSNDNVKL